MVTTATSTAQARQSTRDQTMPQREGPGRPPKLPDRTTYPGRFAARLQELRQRKFPTQDEFVDALASYGVEVTRSTVSSWEIGRTVPTLESWPIIAEVLGISVRSILPPE